MFLSGFSPQQITLQSIINKPKQISLTVSTADCISLNRNLDFYYLGLSTLEDFAACVLTHFSKSRCQLGKNGRHTSTFSTLITTTETEWSCFHRRQLVFMVNNIRTYSDDPCIVRMPLGSELNFCRGS